MAVVHILKDGSIVEDITGHVVRMEDVKALYDLIDTKNRGWSDKKIVQEK